MTWGEAVRRAAGAMVALVAVFLAAWAIAIWAWIWEGAGVARLAFLFAVALVFYVGTFAVGIKAIADAVADNVARRVQSRLDESPPGER